MVCTYQKSALNTINTATQTLTASEPFAFTTNKLLTGVSIAHVAGSTDVRLLNRGMYLVTVHADLTPTAAGDIGVYLTKNGIAVPGAKATVTGATGDTYNLNFASIIRVLPSCAVIDNNATLQVQISAGGTVSNAELNVVKLA